MKAFHGDQKIKDLYLNRVLEHRKLDEITKGVYFQDGLPGKRRMCAVGCTIHSSNHNAYEEELGIPDWLARVEDVIFEGLPSERSKIWPEQFLSAVNVGSDLEKVRTPFCIIILEHSLKSLKVIDQSEAAVREMIRLHKSKEYFSIEYWLAWSVAAAAARSAGAGGLESAYEYLADELLKLIREIE